MTDQDAQDPEFHTMTARLLRREALRRATEGLNTTTGAGLEDVLAQVSAEVTAEAEYRRANAAQDDASVATDATPVVKPPHPVGRS